MILHPAMSGPVVRATPETPQYTLRKILLLWFAVAAPMGLFRFVLHPWLMPRVDLHPGILYWWLMIVGMMWQCALTIVVLRRESNQWTWRALKARLWLNPPVHPERHRCYLRAYLYTVPVILFAFAVEQSGWLDWIETQVISWWPVLESPSYILIQSLQALADSGAWYILGIALISSVFNYLLGEELFFRGLLLPRMIDVFGRYAWAANGVLFATYHVHKIAEVPVFIVGSLFYGFLNQRYRSFWPSVLIHGVEGVVLIGMILSALMMSSHRGF
ncbi:MAG: CPBP family intramembrane glutamic endopeptidase [Usitatibacteraceae bacterium]